MGAISEAFRLAPGTLRSVHPDALDLRTRAGAEEIVAGHERADTPFGEGTPFPRIVDRDALQLFFGCGTGAITMYHSFECIRVPPFPLDVFADRRFNARCVDRDGHELACGRSSTTPRFIPAGSTRTRGCSASTATPSSSRRSGA